MDLGSAYVQTNPSISHLYSLATPVSSPLETASINSACIVDIPNDVQFLAGNMMINRWRGTSLQTNRERFVENRTLPSHQPHPPKEELLTQRFHLPKVCCHYIHGDFSTPGPPGPMSQRDARPTCLGNAGVGAARLGNVGHVGHVGDFLG
jgi:hypothetical protein